MLFLSLLFIQNQFLFGLSFSVTSLRKEFNKQLFFSLSLASSNHDEENQEQEYRSISDYMGGWHAGKFDFDTRICGVTALNYEKSVVFGNAVQRKSNSVVAPLFKDENTNTPPTLPKWATRVVDCQSTMISTLRLTMKELNSSPSSSEDMVITNEELSWEPFYATIETMDGSTDSSPLIVSPAAGTLAPRGGAEIYTDSCQFTVSLSDEENANRAKEVVSYNLIVRTELDSWVWHIELE